MCSELQKADVHYEKGKEPFFGKPRARETLGKRIREVGEVGMVSRSLEETEKVPARRPGGAVLAAFFGLVMHAVGGPRLSCLL